MNLFFGLSDNKDTYMGTTPTNMQKLFVFSVEDKTAFRHQVVFSTNVYFCCCVALALLTACFV